LACTTGITVAGVALGAVGGDTRGGSCSPRRSISMSSRVSVSRSSSASATGAAAGVLGEHRLGAVVRLVDDALHLGVHRLRRLLAHLAAARSSRPRKTSCSLSPTRIGPMRSESPHCDT
jgi:hypothetical protein